MHRDGSRFWPAGAEDPLTEGRTAAVGDQDLSGGDLHFRKQLSRYLFEFKAKIPKNRI